MVAKINSMKPNGVGHTDSLKKNEWENLVDKANQKKSERESRLGKDYNTSFSSRSLELQDNYQKAFQIAMQTSDVREDKVSALKKKIENGEYTIDAGKVADGILRETIKEHLSINS